MNSLVLRKCFLAPTIPEGDASKIIENIKTLNISEEEKRMILGENAIKLLVIR